MTTLTEIADLTSEAHRDILIEELSKIGFHGAWDYPGFMAVSLLDDGPSAVGLAMGPLDPLDRIHSDLRTAVQLVSIDGDSDSLVDLSTLGDIVDFVRVTATAGLKDNQFQANVQRIMTAWDAHQDKQSGSAH